MTYETRNKLIPDHILMAEKRKFCDAAVHLLPIINRNAFYVKEEEIEDQSINSEVCSSEQVMQYSDTI